MVISNSQPGSDKLPTRPGVYIMRDKTGRVVYVGKAKNIQKRVRSYFNKTQQPIKTKKLIEKIAKVEPIVVDNEVEALVLENELIKRHRPPFNVVMRDDKNYLYIRIDPFEDLPQIQLVRKVVKDKAKYFGPYVDSQAVKRTIQLLQKIFPLCTARRIGRACLNYHLKICPGICVGEISGQAYRGTIDQVIDFLSGHYDKVVKQTIYNMDRLATDKKFEQAARLRDAIAAVRKISEQQKIVTTNLGANQDIVGLARRLNKAVMALWQVRSGRLVNQQLFVMEDKYESDTSEVVASFLRDYYSVAPSFPKEILLSQPVKNASAISRWLSRLAKRSVTIGVPQRGRKRQLANLVDKNARVKFDELANRWELDERINQEGTKRLKRLLKLAKLDRIEAYDISNIQGSDAVGSMVVFEKRKMDKQQYRRFRIKSVTGPNDFASLAEVLRRRFRRSELAGERVSKSAFAKNPDLILIDGGKGQVNTVARALRGLQIKIIGVVKGSRSVTKAKDDLVLPFIAKPLILSTNNPAKLLLQNIRDEAHRFAYTYHTILRRKRVTQSQLESIPGVGAVTRKKLLKAFGSLPVIKRTNERGLADIVGDKLAKKIKAHL